MLSSSKACKHALGVGQTWDRSLLPAFRHICIYIYAVEATQVGRCLSLFIHKHDYNFYSRKKRSVKIFCLFKFESPILWEEVGGTIWFDYDRIESSWTKKMTVRFSLIQSIKTEWLRKCQLISFRSWTKPNWNSIGLVLK